MIEHRKFYIDGNWVDPAIPRDCDVIDPSTEEACAVISLGSEADTNAAVAAARRALPGWAETTLEISHCVRGEGSRDLQAPHSRGG